MEGETDRDRVNSKERVTHEEWEKQGLKFIERNRGMRERIWNVVEEEGDK